LIIPKEVIGDDYNNQIDYSIMSEASTSCPGTFLYTVQVDHFYFIELVSKSFDQIVLNFL